MIFAQLWQIGEVLKDWREASLLEGQEDGSRELLASQLHLGPLEGDGTTSWKPFPGT